MEVIQRCEQPVFAQHRLLAALSMHCGVALLSKQTQEFFTPLTSLLNGLEEDNVREPVKYSDHYYEYSLYTLVQC